jgi:hypothetical protein
MNRIGLSQRAQNDLLSLNLVFLGLVRSRAGGHGRSGSEFGLDRPLLKALAKLSHGELAIAAACPFALCSFGLNNREDWEGLLARQVSEPAAADHWPGEAGRRRQFVAVALAMIRDLSATESHAAALFFGLPPMLGAMFAATDLATLPSLAERLDGSLRARLAGHPQFWPELIAAASSDSVGRQRAIRDLGLQLTLQRTLGIDGKNGGGPLCRLF